jgi:hypothetical protein
LEGLSIVEQNSDSVKGSFSRDGAVLSFELSKNGDTRRASIRDGSGAPILEAHLEDLVEDTVFLGGEGHVRGRVGEDGPEITGDERVFEHLNANPAGRLVPALKEALRAAGVESSRASSRRQRRRARR